MKPPRPHIIGVLAVIVVACSSDESRDPTSPTQKTPRYQAVFVDGAVSGLEFDMNAASGLTGVDGSFAFNVETLVEFSVGDIFLGNALTATRMSPLNIARAQDVDHPVVTSIARFLQTIDDDATPSNGIQITEAVRLGAAGLHVDFNQSPAEFDQDPAVLAVIDSLTSLTTAGSRTLVTTDDARDHLTASLRDLYAGDYTGKYCFEGGDNGGTWTMHVGIDSTVELAFTGTPGFQAFGFMSLSGEIAIYNDDLDLFVGGKFEPDFNGEWVFGTDRGPFGESVRCTY